MVIHKLRNTVLFSLSLALVVSLCGCANFAHVETTQAEDQTVDQAAELVFSYSELPFPEVLSSADHLYCCYQSASHTLLSVRSPNGRQVGPTHKTDLLALYDLKGEIVSFPVKTDAYITSAVPYADGIIYIDYVEQTDGSAAWSVVLTDGAKETVLDTGTAFVYDWTPYLFYVQNTPYYLCKDQDGFSVKRIVNGTAQAVFSKTGCELAKVMASSNEDQYCLAVKYPDVNYPHLLICNEEGIQYEHALQGKITSYTVTDRYAVCVTGKEDTQKCSVEVIDLSTGQAAMFAQPFGALWGLKGAGSVCVCVDYRWLLYTIDPEKQEVSGIPGPKSQIHTGTPLLFYPAGESQFFVLSQQQAGYAFYLLTASSE